MANAQPAYGTAGGSLFGAVASVTPTAAAPFGSVLSATAPFGGTGIAAPPATAAAAASGGGTPYPFQVVTVQDSFMRNGQQVAVNARLQCVCAMREYEGKSPDVRGLKHVLNHIPT